MTFQVGDAVRVRHNPATNTGGATGTILRFRKKSALVRWTDGVWADWIAVARLEKQPTKGKS